MEFLIGVRNVLLAVVWAVAAGMLWSGLALLWVFRAGIWCVTECVRQVGRLLYWLEGKPPAEWDAEVDQILRNGRGRC